MALYNPSTHPLHAQVAARHASLEDAARKMDSEASQVRRHLAQANGSLKMLGQKCTRIERALEGAREAEQAAYEQRTQVCVCVVSRYLSNPPLNTA
jgi:phage shock protein A